MSDRSYATERRSRGGGGVMHTMAGNYVSGTGTAGVDNTAQDVVTIVVPANTMKEVGDRLWIRAYWSGTTGSPITGTMKLNTVTISHTTDGGTTTLQVNEVFLHYIDATHANIIEEEIGALGALSAVNVDGFNWAADQNLVISQDQIGNNHIVVYFMAVNILPK